MYVQIHVTVYLPVVFIDNVFLSWTNMKYVHQNVTQSIINQTILLLFINFPNMKYEHQGVTQSKIITQSKIDQSIDLLLFIDFLWMIAFSSLLLIVKIKCHPLGTSITIVSSFEAFDDHNAY